MSSNEPFQAISPLSGSGFFVWEGKGTMHVSAQTALRNHRLYRGPAARGGTGLRLPGAEYADADTSAYGGNGSHANCVCSSDHCTGTPGNEYCRTTGDADSRTHDATADYRDEARDADANASTAYYLNLNFSCCGDPGDCQPDARCGIAANGTA